MSSGTLCSTPNQPALSGVFRPNSAPSQHPSASQLSHLPSNNSPWHQASQNPAGCGDPAAGLGLQLGPAGRTGPRSLFQKKQLSGLGKPLPSAGLLSRPDSAPSLQYAPPAQPKGFRGPGGNLVGLDMATGTGAGLGGSSIRFAPAGSQGGFWAAASRPLLPPDSQQDMDVYQPSQQPQIQMGSQQQHMPEFGHSMPMLTQGSAGMDGEGLGTGTNRLQGAAVFKQPHAGSSSSALAPRGAGQQQQPQHQPQQQQMINLHAASFEATQATNVTEPSQQQLQHLQLDPSQPTPAASILPASTDTMLAAPPARCKQTPTVLQTPQAPAMSPAGAAGGPAPPAPAVQHTPQAPAGNAAAAAAAAAANAATQEQQQQLLTRISRLEDHCSSMKDICERDIPLLLQHNEDSSKQLQALTAAANSTSNTNSILHTQLENLASSVASFMSEFRHWQEQHAGQDSTVLAHAECQTTPGLAAATAATAGQQGPTHPAAGAGAKGMMPLPQSGGRAGAGASADSSRGPSSARPSGSTHTAGLCSKGPSDGKPAASRQSGSLMDFLFSQPPAGTGPPAGPAAAGAAALASEEPTVPIGGGLLPSRAIMSPSGTRFQRNTGTPSRVGAAAAGQDAQPQHTHSPFAVSMLAEPAVQPAAAAAAAPTHEDSRGSKRTTPDSSVDPTGAKPPAAAHAKKAPADEDSRGSKVTPASSAEATGAKPKAAAARAKKAPAKRKPAAGGAGKGRGRKAAAATAAADAAAGAAPAAAAAGSRRQSARCSQKKALQQQKASSADGLTQSKLVFQRATRSVAAAAAALGATLSGDPPAADHTRRTAPTHAATAPDSDPAAAAPPAAAEPSLKRQRLTAQIAGAADGADGASGRGVAASHRNGGADADEQQAADEEQMPAWISPHSKVDSRPQQDHHQQQQGVVAFRRQNRPSQQQQQLQPESASAQISSASGAEVRPLGATNSKPFEGRLTPPAATMGVRAVPAGPAAGNTAANAPAGTAGCQTGRLSSMQAAAGTGSAGKKRDASGHLLFGRPPAAAAAPPAAAAAEAAAVVAPKAPAAGLGVGRRSSQVARPSGGRKVAAATSSAVLLFGDVDDDAISKGTKRSRDNSKPLGPSAAAAGEGSKAGLPAPGLSRPPAATTAPTAGPRVAAGMGAGLPLAAAAAGLPPRRPSVAAAPATQACYDFDAQSDRDDDTDSDHSDSLDAHPSSRQRRDDDAAHQLLLQQQEQERLSEEECKRMIQARMERHRSKQRRSLAMAAGSSQGGAWEVTSRVWM